jgi:DNA-binding MarR family transcriptional regulator/GNAT superfamily N-acetyltransferase
MNSALTHADIQSVREASRRIVRALGFMRSTLADTDLSPSAVHAIVELGRAGQMTANQLATLLMLEKSSVSRMLSRLIEKGFVAESPNAADGRKKQLSLTPEGLMLGADIDRFANQRVGRALHALNGDGRASAIAGLKAYAQALEMATDMTLPGRLATEIEISAGYRPGAIGRIAAMHGRYYAREWGFPPVFEAKVAGGLADFVPRLDRQANQMWLALENGEIVGSAAIDGEDLGAGKAHLRWVIVDDAQRGSGTGRRLLTEAIAFSDARGFDETHLWTFAGLDAARRLYESFGFVLVDEWQGEQWGRTIPEQRFVRRK